jgi:cation diffusion facilitator family transporter
LRKQKVAMLSIYSNSSLVAMKFAAGILMGSVSVISEGIHSTIDLVAAIIANYSVRKSAIPADQDHPYGHGKYENYAGVIEAILIFFAAMLIVYESITRIIVGAAVEFLEAGVIIMGISAVMNFFVSRRLYRVGIEEDSMALQADGLHLRTDVLTSLGVFAGLIVIRLTAQQWLDPVIAIGVALLIVKAAYDLTREASKGLVDEALPTKDEAVVRQVLQEYAPQYVNFHALRSRKSGAERFIDLHLVVNREMCIMDAHSLCEEVEKEIERRLPHTNVLIHVEPCESKDCPLFDERRFIRMDRGSESQASEQEPTARR